MTQAPDARLGNPDWIDNWTLGGGLRFEVMESATQRVFICQQAVTAGELDAFDPPDGFGRALVGEPRADQAWFARSPEAEVDGPVETADIGGRRFCYVARPLGIEALASGAVEMTIDKHHAMLYRAGRTIDVLDFGDGTVATPAWGSRDRSAEVSAAMLVDGWHLRQVELAEDLVTFIPNPARVIVLDNAFGFHGPVEASVVNNVAKEKHNS